MQIKHQEALGVILFFLISLLLVVAEAVQVLEIIMVMQLTVVQVAVVGLLMVMHLVIHQVQHLLLDKETLVAQEPM